MNYYRDFVFPNKQYRTPTAEDRELLKCLRDELADYNGDDEKEIQTLPFAVARKFDLPPKSFFKMFYEVVFGQERGPRFGTFVKLVGKKEALSLLDKACSPPFS